MRVRPSRKSPGRHEVRYLCDLAGMEAVLGHVDIPHEEVDSAMSNITISRPASHSSCWKMMSQRSYPRNYFVSRSEAVVHKT
jgi:hypothetical protein